MGLTNNHTMAGPPRILHLITGIDVGGAENHLLDLCRGQVERGASVTVLYLKGDGELVSEFRSVGCTVERIGIQWDFDPVGFFRTLAHFRRNEYDVVHLHLMHANVYGVPAARIAGVPTVVATKHNDEQFWQKRTVNAIHNFLLDRIDAVITISDHVRRYLCDVTDVDPSKVETVHYGFDPSPFDDIDEDSVQAVRREFAADDAPLVGTVARLTEQKDLPTLLRAHQRVLEDHSDAHLAVVGRGERESALKRHASELGIRDSVTFAGFRRDIPELMHAFDLFALPSRWEGFGVVFMEAMAAGTPIVASNTSAIPEVVADGQNGVLCAPGDADSFASAIADLLGDPERAYSYGASGRERLETEFTIDRMVSETSSVYRSAGVEWST